MKLTYCTCGVCGNFIVIDRCEWCGTAYEYCENRCVITSCDCGYYPQEVDLD